MLLHCLVAAVKRFYFNFLIFTVDAMSNEKVIFARYLKGFGRE